MILSMHCSRVCREICVSDEFRKKNWKNWCMFYWRVMKSTFMTASTLTLPTRLPYTKGRMHRGVQLSARQSNLKNFSSFINEKQKASFSNNNNNAHAGGKEKTKRIDGFLDWKI